MAGRRSGNPFLIQACFGLRSKLLAQGIGLLKLENFGRIGRKNDTFEQRK